MEHLAFCTSRRRLLAHTAAALGVAGLGSTLPSVALANHHEERSAPWPTRPLRILVGFGGGSSPDLTARTFAEPLAKVLGTSVVVESKVGAGGGIAAAEVARSSDHHTIGLMINANLTIAKILNPRATYDPLTELAPLSLIGVSPLVLAATTRDVPSDVRAFFAAARRAGTSWSYGSPGIGTMGHLGMELLSSRAQMAPVHIPYSGYAQVAAALVSGELQLGMLPPALALAQEAAGKVQLLGVTSNARSPLVPHIPTLGELGVGLTGLDLQVWNAFAASARMPQPVRERISAAIVEVARSTRVREQLFAQGWQVVATSQEGLARRIEHETRQMGAVIERLKLQQD